MDPVCTADAREGTASVNDVLIEFGQWLDRQRGLAPITITNYRWNVEQFLRALPQPTQESVSLLDSGTVTAFMVQYCRDRNTNSAKSMRLVEHRSRCGARSRCRQAGIWRRCHNRCRQQTLSAF
jgi:integrase/recombinase XerD